MDKNTSKIFGNNEINIIARLSYEKKVIVSNRELEQMFNMSESARKKIVFRLKNKDVLTPVKRGIYIFSPLEAGPQGRAIDELLIPPLYFTDNNYYIGYATMYNYYGFTDQVFQTVYVLNTSFTKDKVIAGIQYKFLKVPEARMYGLKTVQINDTEVMISNKEKTLVDLVYFNKPIGGIERALEIVKNVIDNNDIDIKKIIIYATRFPNITLRKRFGVLLEELNITEKLLQPLIKSVENTSVSSLTGSRKGTLNKKWRVIVNAS